MYFSDGLEEWQDHPHTAGETEEASPAVDHQHLAVLVADVAGFSRLIERDPLDAALRVHELQARLIEPLALQHGGRVVDRSGDGVLIVFTESDAALSCAVAIQRRLNRLAQSVGEERRLALRIGISADTVLLIEGAVYGLAVNIAARLQAMAQPGDVYLSSYARNEVKQRATYRLEPLGARRLRNIAKGMRLYRVCRAELAT